MIMPSRKASRSARIVSAADKEHNIIIVVLEAVSRMSGSMHAQDAC